MEWLLANPAIIEGEIEVAGTKYPVFRSQSVPSQTWNMSLKVAELMSVTVIDLGHGKRETLMQVLDNVTDLLEAPQPSVRGNSPP